MCIQYLRGFWSDDFFFLRLYPITNYLVYSMHLLPFIMVALSSNVESWALWLAHSFSDWLLHVVSISILWRVHDKRKMRFRYWLCNFETTAIKFDRIGTPLIGSWPKEVKIVTMCDIFCPFIASESGLWK